MKRVGFQGGSSIFELGVASDMVCFFSALREKVELSECELLLLDRLYRRYLRFEELDEVSMLMRNSKNYLSRVPSSIVELKVLGWRPEKSNLNTACESFTEVFIKYFDGFEYCAESARSFYDDWGIYKPVRAIVCDMPDYMVEKLRSLDDYDNLGPSDAPFWLR
ncbi:hypothetical protein V2K16_26650 [Pseudomonas alliivorans]|uniref:hypothetical protein n=1 Tax=Pseudomonas alliivorans TaxID=2810613 RepID=UPI001AE30E51|nr:hypothetical protein [Pseudomonas alliivorans]MBP0943678.1 hypothetical protein [Pseudomonas alliivorans]MEE4881894.1 hypothetical protein [Pseudomonas alliivorans]MEE4933260.1 hypothetical protein [Pseudomonas alliivorans]MEE4938546.1 hypothetical protein [Pseudomonas alliivorans]MEE4943755.1 hypothetical protein [Pseudomonas alliivorans]